MADKRDVIISVFQTLIERAEPEKAKYRHILKKGSGINGRI